MQFEFTSKYKIPAIVLMVLGGIPIGVSFASGDVTRSLWQ
jgi:hypothetical protein